MTVGKDSEDRIQLFLREINLNPEDNQYFKFTDDQSLLLFNVSRVSSDLMLFSQSLICTILSIDQDYMI